MNAAALCRGRRRDPSIYGTRTGTGVRCGAKTSRAIRRTVGTGCMRLQYIVRTAVARLYRPYRTRRRLFVTSAGPRPPSAIATTTKYKAFNALVKGKMSASSARVFIKAI